MESSCRFSRTKGAETDTTTDTKNLLVSNVRKTSESESEANPSSRRHQSANMESMDFNRYGQEAALIKQQVQPTVTMTAAGAEKTVERRDTTDNDLKNGSKHHKESRSQCDGSPAYGGCGESSLHETCCTEQKPSSPHTIKSKGHIDQQKLALIETREEALLRNEKSTIDTCNSGREVSGNEERRNNDTTTSALCDRILVPSNTNTYIEAERTKRMGDIACEMFFEHCDENTSIIVPLSCSNARTSGLVDVTAGNGTDNNEDNALNEPSHLGATRPTKATLGLNPDKQKSPLLRIIADILVKALIPFLQPDEIAALGSTCVIIRNIIRLSDEDIWQPRCFCLWCSLQTVPALTPKPRPPQLRPYVAMIRDTDKFEVLRRERMEKARKDALAGGIEMRGELLEFHNNHPDTLLSRQNQHRSRGGSSEAVIANGFGDQLTSMLMFDNYTAMVVDATPFFSSATHNSKALRRLLTATEDTGGGVGSGAVEDYEQNSNEFHGGGSPLSQRRAQSRNETIMADERATAKNRFGDGDDEESDSFDENGATASSPPPSPYAFFAPPEAHQTSPPTSSSKNKLVPLIPPDVRIIGSVPFVRFIQNYSDACVDEQRQRLFSAGNDANDLLEEMKHADRGRVTGGGGGGAMITEEGGSGDNPTFFDQKQLLNTSSSVLNPAPRDGACGPLGSPNDRGEMGNDDDDDDDNRNRKRASSSGPYHTDPLMEIHHKIKMEQSLSSPITATGGDKDADIMAAMGERNATAALATSLEQQQQQQQQQNVAPATSLPLTKKVLRKFAAINKSSLTLVQREEASRSLFASKQRLLEANHKRQMQRQEGGAKEHSKRKNGGGGEEGTLKTHKYSQKQKKASQPEEKDRHIVPGAVDTSNLNHTTARGNSRQPQDDQDVTQRVFSRRGVPQNDKNKQKHEENVQRSPTMGANGRQMENDAEEAGDAEDATKNGSPDRSQAVFSPAEDDDVDGRDEDEDHSHHHQPQTDADPDPDAGNDHHQNEDEAHACDDTHHENWFQEEADRESACGSDITLWSTSNGSLERELNHEYQQLLLNEQQEQQELEELMRRLKEARSARNRRLRRKRKQQQHQRPRMPNEKENELIKVHQPTGNLNTINLKDCTLQHSDHEHLDSNGGARNIEGEEDYEMPPDDEHHGDDDEYDDFHDDDDDEQQMINAENELVMGRERGEEEPFNVTSKPPPTLTTSMAESPSVGGENDRASSKVLLNRAAQLPASPATNMLSSSSSALINPNMINNNNRGPPSPTLRWCDLSANTQRLVALEYADINNKNGTGQDQPANNVCAVTGRRQRTHRSSRSGHSNRSVVSLQSLANSNKGKGGIALAPAVVERAKAIIGEHVPSHLDNGIEGLSYGGAMMVPSRSASAVNTPQVLPMSGRIEMKRMWTEDNVGEKIPSFSLPPVDSPLPAVVVAAGSARGESSPQPKKKKKRGGSSSRASSRSRRSATTAATETLANEEENELSGGEESSRRAHTYKTTAKTIKKSEKTKSKSSSQGGDGESVLMRRRRKRKKSHLPRGACSSRKTVDTEATNTENLSSASSCSSVGDDCAPPRNSRTMTSSTSSSASSSSSSSGEEEETATRVTQSIAEFSSSSSSDEDGSYESDTESSSSEEGSGSGSSSSESASGSESFSSEEGDDDDEESSEGEEDRVVNGKGRPCSTNQQSLVMISSSSNNVAEGYGAYDSDATLDDEDLSPEQIENLKRMYDKVIRMIVGDKKKRPCLPEPSKEEGEEQMGTCLKVIEPAENDAYLSLTTAAVVHENDNKLTIRKSHSQGWVAQRSALKTSSTTSAIDSYARTWALNNQNMQNQLQCEPMQRLELQQPQASQRKHAKQNESAEIKPDSDEPTTVLVDVREPRVSRDTKMEPLSSLVMKSPHLKQTNPKTTQSSSNSALLERRSISPKPNTVSLGAEEGECDQQERPTQRIATPRPISGCSALCIATCDGAGGEKHHHHPKCSRHVTISQESVARHDERHLQHLQRKAVAMVSAMDSDGFVPKVILRAVDSVSNASASMASPHSTTVDPTAAVDESFFSSVHSHGSVAHSVSGSADGSGTSAGLDPYSATGPNGLGPTNPMISSATANKIVAEQNAFVGSSTATVAGVTREISGGQTLVTSTAATSSQPIITNSGVPPPPSSSVVATVVEVLLENPHLVTDTTATVEGRLGLITTHQKEREGQHGPLSGLDVATAASASGSGATLRGGPHEPSLSLAQSGGGALPDAVVGRSPYALAGPQHTQNGNSKSAAKKPAPPMTSQIPAPSTAFFEWLNTATAALPVSTILGAVDRGMKDKERTIGGINVKASVGNGLSQSSALQASTGPKDPLAPIVAAHLSARKKTTVDSHAAPVVSNSGATVAKDDSNMNAESGIENRSNHLEQFESVSHTPPRVLFLPSSRVSKATVDFALNPDITDATNVSPNQADTVLSSLIVGQKEASKLDVANNNKFEGEEVTVDEIDTNDEDDNEWYRPLAQRSMKNVAEQLGLWKHAYVCSIKDATQTCLSKEEILHINWEMTITAPAQLPPVLRSTVTPPLNPTNPLPTYNGGGAGGITSEVPLHLRKVPISFDTDGMARCDIFPPMHYQVVSNGKEVSLGHLQRLPVYRGPINASTMKGPRSQKPAPRPMGSGAAGVGIFANLVRRSQEQNSTNNNSRASPSPQSGRSLFGNVGSRTTTQTATSAQHASTPADPPPPPPLTYRTHVPLWSVNLEEKASRQRELRDMSHSRSEAPANSLFGVCPRSAAYSFTDRWCWTVGNNALAIVSVDIPRPEYVNLLMQHGA